VILGLDYRAFENDVNLLGIQLGHDVTVHPVSLTYAGSWTMDRGSAGFFLTGLRNLPGEWAGRDGAADFEKARAGAPRGYGMLRYGANLTHLPGGDWQVRASANGQFTNDPLVASEQFGIGGASSVRGFHEREIAGDRGYSGSVEIYSPDLCRLLGIPSIQSRALLFYDRGYVARRNALPGETVSAEVASIGPGLRITDGRKFSVSVDWGLVVDPPDANTTRWSGVWHLSASVLF
jgi:hemolysin activation/secretion protein